MPGDRQVASGAIARRGDPEIYGIMHASLIAPVEEVPADEPDPQPAPDEDVAGRTPVAEVD
jgi:hypothetical protein